MENALKIVDGENNAAPQNADKELEQQLIEAKELGVSPSKANYLRKLSEGVNVRSRTQL